MGVQPPDQGHPVPRLPLQQPVVVQPLHELVLPLQGEPTADLVQPEGSTECHGASCKAAMALQTLGSPDEALQCCVNAPSKVHTIWDNVGYPHVQTDVSPFYTGGSH